MLAKPSLSSGRGVRSVSRGAQHCDLYPCRHGRSAIRSPGAIVIIIAGNIFITGFEGLICIIQSMRLEYYEFFSKFFRGDGVGFAPFTLKERISEV
jgi:vacuolar-type H+-ATPase subunit I/STV1